MTLRRSARNMAKSSAQVPVADLHQVDGNGHAETSSKAPNESKTTTKRSTKVPDTSLAVPDLPATPLPKKRKAAQGSPTKPLPFTPTPAGVGLIISSSPLKGSDHPLDDLASLNSRPAEPHSTNAPLLTPDGSKVVAYTHSHSEPENTSPQSESVSSAKKRKTKELVPPDVGTLNPPTLTTDTLLSDAEAFLINVDPKLKNLVEKHKCKIFTPEGLKEVVDPFTALSSGIIGQQVPPPPTPTRINYNIDSGKRLLLTTLSPIGIRSSCLLHPQKVRISIFSNYSNPSN